MKRSQFKNRLLRCLCMSMVLVGLETASYARDNYLPAWALGGFTRPEGVNPMVSPTDKTRFKCPLKGVSLKWECADTFNPAAVEKDGKVVVLYRAEDDPTVGIGKRTSRIGYVESSDGIHVDYRAQKPVMYPNKTSISKTYEWPGGTEDPRVVEAEVDGAPLYVMTYTGWNRDTPRLCVATSRDLKHWTHYGPVFADAYNGKFLNLACKSGSIVTAPRDGRLQAVKVKMGDKERYLMYWGEAWVCAALSDDLIHWEPVVDAHGDLDYLVKPRKGYFDSMLTECGPPAVITEHGIVLLYNGKNHSGSDADPDYPSNTYAAGQMLFSMENPLVMVERLDKPFFRPMADFEKSGQYAAGTVFVEGLVLHGGKWYLYYGCADSFVGVAVYDPEKSEAVGDPVELKVEIPERILNQKESASSEKGICKIHSCSGMVNEDESPENLNMAYIHPSRKWCDESTKHPWVVFEFTEKCKIDRLVFNDVDKREDNCGNVPEYWVYVRSSEDEEWSLVAHEQHVADKGKKDISFSPVSARYVKLMLTRGIRPSGVEDSATRLYGVDIYGERD